MIEEQSSMRRVRTVVCFALLVYCGGIVALSWLPLDTVVLPEAIVGAVAVFAAIGVVARMTTHITLPGEQYAYLFAAFAGLATTIGYSLGATNEPVYTRAGIACLLLTGVIGGYGAHLAREDGV